MIREEAYFGVVCPRGAGMAMTVRPAAKRITRNRRAWRSISKVLGDGAISDTASLKFIVVTDKGVIVILAAGHFSSRLKASPKSKFEIKLGLHTDEDQLQLSS